MEPLYAAAHKVALETPDLAPHFMRIYHSESARYHGLVAEQRHRLRAGPPISPMMPAHDMLAKAREQLAAAQAAAASPQARMQQALAEAERHLHEAGRTVDQMRALIRTGLGVQRLSRLTEMAQSASNMAVEASNEISAAGGLAEDIRVAAYEADAQQRARP